MHSVERRILGNPGAPGRLPSTHMPPTAACACRSRGRTRRARMPRRAMPRKRRQSGGTATCGPACASWSGLGPSRRGPLADPIPLSCLMQGHGMAAQGWRAVSVLGQDGVKRNEQSARVGSGAVAAAVPGMRARRPLQPAWRRRAYAHIRLAPCLRRCRHLGAAWPCQRPACMTARLTGRSAFEARAC